MIYSACCSQRCASNICQAKAMGACLCACKIIYGIEMANQVISGRTYSSFGNFKYLPDPAQRKLEYDAMTPEQKKEFDCDRDRRLKRSLEILEIFKSRLSKYKVI